MDKDPIRAVLGLQPRIVPNFFSMLHFQLCFQVVNNFWSSKQIHVIFINCNDSKAKFLMPYKNI